MNTIRISTSFGDKEFKKIVRAFAGKLDLHFVTPEQLVIKQTEECWHDEAQAYHPETYFYMILSGVFKVTSLEFNRNKRLNEEQKKLYKRLKFSKTLTKGDYFGEVGIMYKASRSATVISKQYATLGILKADDFVMLLKQFPRLKSFLMDQAMLTYDDDLKLFLMEALRRVPYLSKCRDQLLSEIAFSLKTNIREKGSILYRADEDEEEQVKDEMVIIFDGQMEVYTIMDAGNEFSFEILPPGSVINSTNMLAERKHVVNYRFLSSCTYYTIKYDKLVDIAINELSSSLVTNMVEFKGYAESNKTRDEMPMDYIIGNPNFFDPR